jgi:hypothetical protein
MRGNLEKRGDPAPFRSAVLAFPTFTEPIVIEGNQKKDLTFALN